MEKVVVVVMGIRPDFIRMSEIIKKLGDSFKLYVIHTGQHYDEIMSDVFFKDLDIRKPDYNLGIGGPGKEHFHQTADISVKLIELLRKENIKPDTIMFLGDSNSVMVAPILKKEGYHISHVEAGMRSFDKRMLEEINRTVCDHCTDLHFVYHENYKLNLVEENLPPENIYVVGNTIVEVCNMFIPYLEMNPKTMDFILMDIHRPENFKYKDRLRNLFILANLWSGITNVPVKMLKFGRTMSAIKEFEINTYDVEFIDLMSYRDFLKAQYDCLFMISDSGTAQEEPALLNTPVLVPRDYTERPESVWANCSYMVDIMDGESIESSREWLSHSPNMDTTWLGEGTTSQQIIDILKERL